MLISNECLLEFDTFVNLECIIVSWASRPTFTTTPLYAPNRVVVPGKPFGIVGKYLCSK